jgi:predicted transcriptional regulator
MRKPRENELLRFLFFFGSEGLTIKEIVGEHEIIEKVKEQPSIRERVVWPRATVIRNLEKLIAANKVIKQRDPRNEECRGRPAFRYQVNPRRKFVLEWPLGKKIRHYKVKEKIRVIVEGKVTEKVIETEDFILRRSREQKQLYEECLKYLSRK